MNGLPTLSSAEIGRLKNTQLSEKEIMARVENGMTDVQADAEASAREKGRAHSGTGFVRIAVAATRFRSSNLAAPF